ncbi:MAG: sulfite exporter TauE/SafE family protein [Paracoccaceae bacterium]|nr:sulfite exporter TauE/SafE family protein [Paracoccaceae bacterium]
MVALFPDIPSFALLLSMGLAVIAGIVKGVVGFAMPMILISGMSSFLAPEIALAGLILPTLITNGMQALRQGPVAAWQSVRQFQLFLGVGLVALLAAAQLVAVLPVAWMLGLIGGSVGVFALMQLAGWRPRLRNKNHRGVEIGVGAFAGFIGGLSGVWGPPTVAYLTALGTEKRAQMRIQGVIYGLGAVALTVAHIGSGIFNMTTVWFSALLVPPAVIGMWLGGQVQDRIDQAAFRTATLVVLLVGAMNLLRRAVFG